jgi:hypothetical protein
MKNTKEPNNQKQVFNKQFTQSQAASKNNRTRHSGTKQAHLEIATRNWSWSKPLSNEKFFDTGFPLFLCRSKSWCLGFIQHISPLSLEPRGSYRILKRNT